MYNKRIINEHGDIYLQGQNYWNDWIDWNDCICKIFHGNFIDLQRWISNDLNDVS